MGINFNPFSGQGLSDIGKQYTGAVNGKGSKFFDPGGFAGQYNPFTSDEEKFGKPPGEMTDAEMSGANTDIGQYYQKLLAGYQQRASVNDPYGQQAMQQAGLASSFDARARGLGSSPYSVQAGEQSRYRAGLDYMQKENARRDTGLTTALGQYGTYQNQQRQMNQTNYQAALDRYQQKRAGHFGPIGGIADMFLPGSGKSLTGNYAGR